MTPTAAHDDGSYTVKFTVSETTLAGSATRVGFGEFYKGNVEPAINSIPGSSGPLSPMRTEIAWTERFYPFNTISPR
ncbi:hypothetical protein [Myceligenerans salitolerans]|uniref:Uncharacterized protein n=1 Tax=Myceligenerans salitolerans TaxID=1230528 RepID=A0ABS3IA32_9MICO|nr:hypothetical protein [Myceligenerans salitolerans]MBO0609855.1 hypothetical protein [Myceligenerans salitolerans]